MSGLIDKFTERARKTGAGCSSVKKNVKPVEQPGQSPVKKAEVETAGDIRREAEAILNKTAGGMDLGRMLTKIACVIDLEMARRFRRAE